MNIDSIGKLLVGSPFEDKKGAIEVAFSAANVKTLSDIDNAPRLLGSSVAGYSTYQICAFLRKAAIEQEIQKSTPVEKVSKPKAKAQAKKVVEDVPKVEEPVAPAEEPVVAEEPAEEESIKE